MTSLRVWHERQARLAVWLGRLANRFELHMTPVEEAVAVAKLGLAIGGPLLAAPLVTRWTYNIEAKGAAAYYWMAASAFGFSILAILRAWELAATETTPPSRHGEVG